MLPRPNVAKLKPLRIQKKKKKSFKDSGWLYVLAPAFILVGGVLTLGYITFTTDALKNKENKAALQWAVKHWQTPIPPQGTPNEQHHLLAQGLQATDCKGCHVRQYEEWSSSLHSQATGAGVLGQYPHFNAAGKAECNVCHAPMFEQWQEVRNEKQWVANPFFSKPLFEEGITCAACHLREHQRHGPPLKPGKESLSQALHGEPIRTAFFQSSEFCKGCHQHHANTLKIGGKTIENTYNEWLQSPAYEQGQTCQSCHMPQGKHLWKGIHDKEMTASGVTISETFSTQTPKIGENFKATLTLKNTASGHRFPTYTTPGIFLKAAFLDEAGQVLPGFYEEAIIQRRLDMSTRPWTEEFDTRLAPNDSLTLIFERKIPAAAKKFMLWVWVEPDHFYEGFYRNLLNSSPRHQGREMLEKALQTTLDRQYSLFAKTLVIDS